jgi:uncharacterized protein YukE
MEFSVNTADLDDISGAFNSASSDVTHLRAVLASGAVGPESVSVIGSSTAASQYTRVLQEWTHNLDQLASSLETMAHKVSAAASVYAQTEANNTVQSAP